MKKAIILILVLAAAMGIVVLKKSTDGSATPLPEHTPGIPRLLDLGASGCTACKMLEPVLQELRTEFKGRLQVDFVDVWKHEEAVEKYGINLIPVQIFFDTNGQELSRHEGFISKEDILAKFKELGVGLNAE